MDSKSHHKPYISLLIALSISYVVMFFLMFSRVNEFANLFLSLNQVYMAGLMIAAMLLIMLTAMGSMYKNKKLNIALLIGGTAIIFMFWTLLRSQAGVGNQQFLRSMIPHHAAAILVCEQASVTDSRIQELCTEIVKTQKEEIRIMKALME
ncbi:DUF305 domain-containing protein [Plectonema cf. radiosum LEGE 06105]|uniref:DUF305 domain-containing protein n=1 Tax=Plectonema cf. radiosum LEGE 06105 TaxID=945769 RepID=A0A8J7JST7_9CYAN|nr:DUF305 domain-containing protein [Plectonema radiosum]MBE9212939.1 DUF305 domain-containing protein [Plectonema cf. radiosum LEGE 06105]